MFGYFIALSVLPLQMMLSGFGGGDARSVPARRGPAKIIHITDDRRRRMKQKLLRRARRGY